MLKKSKPVIEQPVAPPPEIVVPDIQRLVINPGEVLVVTLPYRGFPAREIERIYQRFGELLPDNKVIVVSEMVRLTVIDAKAGAQLEATNGFDLTGSTAR